MDAIELTYPSQLPVSQRRDEIINAIRKYPTVIISGDTGSGKTTQLPKMALELGRGKDSKRIACTQPRRLAAVTMAERVASELKSDIGKLVGYRHRYERKISAETRIEFMTDGILLSETRHDPLLRAYDTIIIDEAHERSLNIDFLLGIVKRALERRKDLKVIISSATIDTDRFAEFFKNSAKIEVSGRLFPIEVRYRPPPEDEERDLPGDVENAIATLPSDGDVLVFLPGERDIRETAEHLVRKRGDTDEIIALYASLPAGEQRRAFAPANKRKIVLSTNVAETSVTIPGIRAVVDSGLARISRYIHRTQIQRLQIEPVSKASAKQRAGRCGRVGPGICIRLYGEDDYENREDFTAPEILRSSLAGVILAMLDLRFGDIERFPFIDPPKPAMIREGLRELLELGAIKRAETGGAELTPIGRKLAKIPIEPRLARILLEASRNAQLSSVIPIVASMACDDPRRRPFEEKESADRAHARFKVPDSDFLGTLKLWNTWQKETEGLSETKVRKLCKAAYLSYAKMREWKDLSRQLKTLADRLGLGGDGKEDPDLIHRSLLAGLIGRIGKFDEEARDYRGAHQLRFSIHPSSALKRKTPPWILSGELVDTAKLFARNVAAIDPRWIEPVAGGICRYSHHSPQWDAASGFVRAIEQVTIYGLVVVPARRCDYSRIDFAKAREIFIRRGIVDGEFPRPPPALKKNLQTISTLRKRSERLRRPDAFDSDGLERFFAEVIPANIASADALRKWLRMAGTDEIKRFTLREKDWLPGENDNAFPETIAIAGKKMRLSYRHTPDDPETDGITCTLKKSDLPVLRLWRSDYLVPGMLHEKLRWHLCALPSQYRRLLSPLEDAANILLPMLKPGQVSFLQALSNAVSERWGFSIPLEAWQTAALPPYLRMRFKLVDDESGKTLAVTRNPEELTPISPSPPQATSKSTVWTFSDIPDVVYENSAGWKTELYPALCDVGDGVTLKLYPSVKEAQAAHAYGLARLFHFAAGKAATIPFRRNRLDFTAALYLKNADYSDEQIAADIGYGAVFEVFVRGKNQVKTKTGFDLRLQECRNQLPRIAAEIHEIFRSAVVSAAEIDNLLEDGKLHETTADSISTQLAWLMYRGFPRNVPLAKLRHYRRYLNGAAIRIARAKNNISGDIGKEKIFAPYWERYREAIRPENRGKHNSAALFEYRWMLEEFRISLFAQELHTPEPISPKRLDQKWAEVGFRK